MAFKHENRGIVVRGIVDAFDDESTHNTCVRTMISIFRHQHQRDETVRTFYFGFCARLSGSIRNDFAILHIFDLMRINGRMMNATATILYSVPLPLMSLTVIICNINIIFF